MCVSTLDPMIWEGVYWVVAVPKEILLVLLSPPPLALEGMPLSAIVNVLREDIQITHQSLKVFVNNIISLLTDQSPWRNCVFHCFGRRRENDFRMRDSGQPWRVARDPRRLVLNSSWTGHGKCRAMQKGVKIISVTHTENQVQTQS